MYGISAAPHGPCFSMCRGKKVNISSGNAHNGRIQTTLCVLLADNVTDGSDRGITIQCDDSNAKPECIDSCAKRPGNLLRKKQRFSKANNNDFFGFSYLSAIKTTVAVPTLKSNKIIIK